MCEIVGCNKPSVHQEPVALCQKHYDEWELEYAEYESDRASAHLERVQKRQRSKYNDEMTERIER